MKTLLLFLFLNVEAFAYKEILLDDPCPKDSKNAIIFMDDCPTEQAEYVTKLGHFACDRRGHGERVIQVYRDAGGKRIVWLFSMLHYLPFNKRFELAIARAVQCKVPIVSVSMVGYGGANRSEYYFIKKFIKAGGKYYASAGNNRCDIDICRPFPALYTGVTAVGSKPCRNDDASYTNYGKKVIYECGDSLDGRLVGTSFATPRAAAKEK